MVYLILHGFSWDSPSSSLGQRTCGSLWQYWVGGTVTPWLILLPSSLALFNKGTFLLSCNGHGGGGWGEARYCLSATKLNRAMFILFANSDDALHGGRGTGRL